MKAGPQRRSRKTLDFRFRGNDTIEMFRHRQKAHGCWLAGYASPRSKQDAADGVDASKNVDWVEVRKRKSSVFRERRWGPAFTGTTIQGVRAT